MESVIKKIRQSRNIEGIDKEAVRRHDNIINVDGYQVKMRFSTLGDSTVIPAIKSMLVSAYVDAANVQYPEAS